MVRVWQSIGVRKVATSCSPTRRERGEHGLNARGQTNGPQRREALGSWGRRADMQAPGTHEGPPDPPGGTGGSQTCVESLYFSPQLYLSDFLCRSISVQFGPSQAIYDRASNVLSKYSGPKMNCFSTHKQAPPLNQPLPRLPKAEISRYPIPAPK